MSPQEMVALLKTRQMTFGSGPDAERFLQYVNYYKLRAYFIHFERFCPVNGHKFLGNTSFEEIVALYKFDRKLRLILGDMLERFEVAVRTAWAFEMSQVHNPFAHLHRDFFTTNLKGWDHSKSLAKLVGVYERSNEQFAEHYRVNHRHYKTPPIWVCVEMMSFGEVYHWLVNTKDTPIRQRIAAKFDLPEKFLIGYVRQASLVRNCCSHHSRLWNRTLAFRPPALRGTTSFNQTLLNTNPSELDKLYNFLVVLNSIAGKMSPGHNWTKKLRDLLDAQDPGRLTPMPRKSNR